MNFKSGMTTVRKTAHHILRARDRRQLILGDIGRLDDLAWIILLRIFVSENSLGLVCHRYWVAFTSVGELRIATSIYLKKRVLS